MKNALGLSFYVNRNQPWDKVTDYILYLRERMNKCCGEKRQSIIIFL